ncbi:MAG: AraC family transcriptional regulator [Clostridiaceae bacterium]
MINKEMKQYEIKNLIDERCPVCEEFSKIYNLETMEHEFKVPKDIGNGHLRQIVSSENIQIINFNTTFNRHMEIEGMSKAPHIDMFFCTGEGLEWEFEGKRNKFELLSGESFLSKTKSRENIKRWVYPPKHQFNFVEIKIHPKKFEQIKEDIEEEWNIFCKGKYDEIFYKNRITPSINLVLQQIINCPYKKGLKNIYMEGKILELLSIYLNDAVYQQEKHNTVKLSNEDITSIYKAKEILDRDIADTPTLTCLSKMICLNEFKLKNGFKEMFGDTVYGYVIDKRLEKARLLLEKKNMQVGEVASQVGYANASHFALAFRKKFGVNPKEYLKNVAEQ